MGKSGKLFKSLVSGVKVFKSPSKESPAKEKSTPTSKKEDKDYVRKKSKDKCFGSLGKSSSRSRDVAACASFPDAIEIKCVQVESEKLKDVLPAADSFSTDTRVGNKGVKAQDAGNIDTACNQVSITNHKEFMTTSDQEKWAASKIQAAFRCYLAQRAFRALKALVRLQALVRGQMVRKQASTSLRCMNAVIRIQALARGHRIRNSELGQLVQKHLQQTKQSRKKPAEGWVNSLATAQQLHAKAQSKQDAVTKRQRALVYAFSEQLNRRTQKQSSSSGLDNNQVDKSHWIWVWLERWTEATLKGSSITAPVEERTPVMHTKVMEKPKTSTKVGKFSESSKKDGRKSIEHADGMAPPSQRGLFAEEKERATNVVSKKEEKAKALTEPEKPSHRKPSLSGSNSTSLVTQKPFSSPPPPSVLPLSPKEDSYLAPVTQPQSSSAASAVLQPTSLSCDAASVVLQLTAPACADESKLATQLSPSDRSLQQATCDSHLAESVITPLSTSSTVQHVLSLNTPSSPNSPSKQPASATSEKLHTGSESPPWKSISNSLSIFSFSPPEACSPIESSLPHPSNEQGTQRVSAPHTPSEQGMLSIDDISLFPPSRTSYLVHESLSSGGPMVEDGLPLADGEDVKEGVHVHTTTGDNDTHVPVEIINHLNGDCEMHTSEDGINENSTADLRAEATVYEETDYKNDDAIQTDALSETNGRCDASVVSVGAKSVEAPNKHTNLPGSKNEPHTECVSPSVPSYMATTRSSQAKVRSLTSPKPKLESPKQKLDSPKLKSDSPKAKIESPTQKPDSSTKRRHSLSAMDGKVSPASHSASHKPPVHVRASSKGHLSSFKDLSTDNLALSNGGSSRRHGK